MKFPIRVDAIWRAPLLASAVTPGSAYVTLNDEGVHFRFGPLFDRTIPYTQIANVFPRSWPVLYGIGLRSNLRGVIGLIGSYHDVVEVRLTKRIRNWVLLFPCDRISVSLEEPERFVQELSRRIGLEAEPIEPLTKPRRAPRQPRAVHLEVSKEEPAGARLVSPEEAPPTPEPSVGRGPSPDGGQPPADQPGPQAAEAAATTSAPRPRRAARPKTKSAKAKPAPKRERRAPTTPTTNGRSTPARAGGRAKRPKAATPARNRNPRRRS
jgi:hypothetical protein